MSHTAVFTLFGIHSTKKLLFLFWTFNMCSSTSLIDIFPLKMAATVRYLPRRGSHAAIMFLASNICWVSSATVRERYCWLPLAVSGANPGMKKWRRGNGTMLTANFLRSAFNCKTDNVMTSSRTCSHCVTSLLSLLCGLINVIKCDVNIPCLGRYIRTINQLISWDKIASNKAPFTAHHSCCTRCSGVRTWLVFLCVHPAEY